MRCCGSRTCHARVPGHNRPCHTRIGRPYAWALAADGEAGVRAVLELFRDELINTMTAAGCPTVGAVSRSLVMS